MRVINSKKGEKDVKNTLGMTKSIYKGEQQKQIKGKLIIKDNIEEIHLNLIIQLVRSNRQSIFVVFIKWL